MGIQILEVEKTPLLQDGDELTELISELHKADRKYRKGAPEKDRDALYHDAQLSHIVRNKRTSSNSVTSAWFLTNDNSIIAHGIQKKEENEPPYSIKLITLLNTLSPFVESQSLKLEFEELFMNLVSNDILPKSYQFTVNDLQMFVGFDMKAKEMPPEFIRKGMAHVKKEILKGGGLTEENKSAVLYEFNKYISSPDKNFIELQRRYEVKIYARDKTIESKDQEIQLIKKVSSRKMETKNRVIIIISSLFISILLWSQFPNLISVISESVKRPSLFPVAIQIILISLTLGLLFQNKRRLVAVSGVIITILAIIIGLI